MNNSDNRDKLEKNYKRWQSVQAYLKRAEQISQTAVIPAINELRYAGRILVAILAEELHDLDLDKSPQDTELFEKSLSDKLAIADQYLINADHDISDAIIYFIQSRVDQINSKFGAASVIAKHPKYSEILDNLQEARHLVIESRGTLAKREFNYNRVKDIVSWLIENYYDLNKSEALLSIQMEKYSRQIRFYKIVAILSSILTLGLAGKMLFL